MSRFNKGLSSSNEWSVPQSASMSISVSDKIGENSLTSVSTGVTCVISMTVFFFDNFGSLEAQMQQMLPSKHRKLLIMKVKSKPINTNPMVFNSTAFALRESLLPFKSDSNNAITYLEPTPPQKKKKIRQKKVFKQTPTHTKITRTRHIKGKVRQPKQWFLFIGFEIIQITNDDKADQYGNTSTGSRWHIDQHTRQKHFGSHVMAIYFFIFFMFL